MIGVQGCRTWRYRKLTIVSCLCSYIATFLKFNSSGISEWSDFDLECK